MQKRKTINGVRYAVKSVQDCAGRGCEVVVVWHLRNLSTGREWTCKEWWERPTMGKHRRVGLAMEPA